METDNKEKLALKELVGYLPYKVEIMNRRYKYPFYDRREIMDLGNLKYLNSPFNTIKPILRPLSDLTKPITHNGETFVPMDEINKIHTLEFKDGLFNDYVSDGWSVIWLPLCIIEKLLEWHFDIHNLIERGLAININDLSNE